MSEWTTRGEQCRDIGRIRTVTLAAFPTAEEADLVEALRADPGAWLSELSVVVEDPSAGVVIGHALASRCWIGVAAALALAPCSMLPEYQRRGAGSAAIRAVLAAARLRGEAAVIVLGHADYYPRFGFTPASRFGVRAPFDAPDEAFMALALDGSRPMPTGTVRYAAAFGVYEACTRREPAGDTRR